MDSTPSYPILREPSNTNCEVEEERERTKMQTETNSATKPATASRAPAPYLKVSPANLATDWDELVDTYWETWKKPLTAWSEISCAFIGTANEAHARAESKKRVLADIRNDPNVHVIKCTDTRSGLIIGGAMWVVHHTNPYRGPFPKKEEPAFPEGSEIRELAESAWTELSKWRWRLMQNAHVCMYISFFPTFL